MRVNFGIEPSCEGFWTKLQHAFTRDSKSAHIMDGLIKKLITLKPEQRVEFDKLRIDFVCPKGDVLSPATKFVETVTKFMVDNFDDIKRAELKSSDSDKLYSDLVGKLNLIRGELDRHMSNFVLIAEEEDAALKKRVCYKDRTYADMGLGSSTVLNIAKDFRRGAASNLAALNKAKWEVFNKGLSEASAAGKKFKNEKAWLSAARTEQIGNFSTFYNYVRIAVKLYAKIDYFLFYTNKKVSKL